MGAWHTADTMGIFQALPELWSGWRTECWEDGFEEQAARCGSALRLPELDLADGIDRARARIRSRVYQRFTDSPAGQVLELSKLLAPIGPGLVVSDDALAKSGALPRDSEWARFVEACDLYGRGHAESA
ncbi:hypothetical protein A5712_21265 [Mycobacterium sp. E2327]|nr:hypothetical protein A5712_21265 [Mycobacterium sp. E2327]